MASSSSSSSSSSFSSADISFGIIGCGDVTEVKSGCLNKMSNAKLVAVMRRNLDKAKDYAVRHSVPNYFNSVDELLAAGVCDAIYIATPPDSHVTLAKQCMEAGIKRLYIEKPIGLNAAEAEDLLRFMQTNGGDVKCTVAHYRRSLPQFKRVKQLVDDDCIGPVRMVNIRTMQDKMKRMSPDDWRINPSISGGGLFNDISPHQLDILINIFGEVEQTSGFCSVYSPDGSVGIYGDDNVRIQVNDLVTGQIKFKSKVIANGQWYFRASQTNGEDSCEIIGEKGIIRFGFFSSLGKVSYTIDGCEEVIEEFNAPKHIQQPMLEDVVKYFQNEFDHKNPCSVEEAVAVMKIIDSFTEK